jgi:hypothetical protein
MKEKFFDTILKILKNNNIDLSENNINGEFLGKDNINNWCIEINETEDKIVYKIYYVDQYFQKQYEEEYNNEDEAIIKFLDKYIHFSGMTINEKLYLSGYMDKYDKINKQNKKEAEKLLEYYVS